MARTHILWPRKLETWRQKGDPIKRAFVKIIDSILRFEPVRMMPGWRPGIVMEGGSFHVDGQGTVLVTEECL